MENPCTIVCFGDSLTARYAPQLAERFVKDLPDIEAAIINRGVGGETSRDGLLRLSRLVEEQPDVVLIGFGMNDQAKGITTEELAGNLSQMVAGFESVGARVLLLTMNPTRGALSDKGNVTIDVYNDAIRDVARETRVRVVDISRRWKRDVVPPEKGLEDACHPNEQGVSVYCDALMQVVPRQNHIILWQYNGNPCDCNYRCPYCPYGASQNGNHFTGTIENWRAAFKKTFGNQRLTFYLAHGEPTIGDRFYDVLQMVGDEPRWELRMTSNISQPLERLVSTRLAEEGRLNINASFHPTMVSRDKFLEQALFLRDHGIEVPVIYVLYPPLFKRFEDDFHFFDLHGFLIHARRFRGKYRDGIYPQAYTDEERRFVAKYSDDATIKYMLCDEPTDGKLTWTGVDFCTIDNEGNVSHCDDYRSGTLGNVFEGSIPFAVDPEPFRHVGVSDGTVDGVANLVELNYRQLTGNNVISFSRQGGVYHTPHGVHYKHMETDFNDSRIRAEYRFPARNLKDAWAVLVHREDDFRTRLRRLASAAFPGLVRYDVKLTGSLVLRNVVSALLGLPVVARRIRASRVTFRRFVVAGSRIALCLWGDCYARAKGLVGSQFKAFGRGCARRLVMSGERRWGWRMFFAPVSLFRYAEFDFALHSGTWAGGPRVLDVSSPRLFGAFLLAHYPELRLAMTNPDERDLAESHRFLAACGLNDDRIDMQSRAVADLPYEDGSFDTIYSISVVEHVPIEGQQAFLDKLWTMLRPGGRLILTVPVAASFSEEWRQDDVYNLGRERNAAGLAFFQRVYDAEALKNQILQPVSALGGQVVAMRTYGLTAGFRYADYVKRWKSGGRSETVKDVLYASKYLRGFDHIAELPDRGVCGIAFVKA